MDMFSSTDSAKNAVDMFPQTAQTRKRLWICSHKQKKIKKKKKEKIKTNTGKRTAYKRQIKD